MTWSESGYTNEQNDNPQNKVEGQSDKVYNTTDFLSKFEGNQNSIVSSCMQEIQSDVQLKEGFDNLLRSGISNDFINKIKQELKDNAELDKETLKILVQSILAESITDFKIGSIGTIEGLTTQKVKEEENAVKEEENAVKEEENAVQNEVKTENYKKLSEKLMEEAKQYIDYLKQKYPELALQVNENLQSVKQKLENNGVLNQLRESGRNEQFINDYISVQATLVELKSNRSSYEESDISFFDGLVKRLDNACNMPDTNLSSFSAENIAQTRTELFNKDSGVGNESLKTARDNNMDSHKEAYGEIFPEMGDDEVVAKYGKFLEGDLKAFWQQYETNRDVIKNKIAEIRIIMMNQQIFNENGENYISDEEKILWNNYKKMLSVTNEIRKETEEQTKNLMEEMCIISQIKGMYMCIGQEGGKDFNLNKANEIINDNGVLTLKGHIDGVDFSVSHDTINPNQRLKIKSKLGVDSEDQNTFEIGKEDNYVNSPFILPSQKEIFGVITKVVQSNDLSKSSDLPKYLEGLQNNIIGTMDEVYKDAKLAHHYVTNKVKGEKIVDNSLAMINSIKPNMQDLTKPINQGSNEKLFSFLKMIKFNVENSDTEEKNKLNQCMAKIPEIIDAYKATGGTQNFAEFKYPPIIENYLKNQTWLENGNEDSKLGLVFDMLSYYNQNSNDTRTNKESNGGVSSKIVINDLYRDLFEFSNNGQSEVGTKRKNENQEKQDKQEAEDVLALNDESIWPPVEYG